MGKGATTGKTFLQGILSKITNPELRTQAEAVFNDAVVQTEVGNGVEGQSEIDRQLQTLRTQETELQTRQQELDARDTSLTDWHGRLQTWHTENNAALTEYSKLKKEGKLPAGSPTPATPAGNGSTPPTGGVTAEQLQETVQTANLGFLGFQRDYNKITREHFTKFNEVIDIEPLLHHPKIRDVGLIGVYELVHADRLKKHGEDATKAAEDKIRADERAKVLAEQQSMPYPLPTGVGSGSPLDALEANKKEPVVDAAVSHYNRLVAERGASAR